MGVLGQGYVVPEGQTPIVVYHRVQIVLLLNAFLMQVVLVSDEAADV